MIFVTVGSRNYPFDRLFKELDRLVEEKVILENIFAQIGTSQYEPVNFKYERFINQETFKKYINESDIVISHGASGSIMQALNAKKKVIAVTRLEKYGEHINDHQISINKAFGENGYVLPVIEMGSLENVYNKLKLQEVALKEWENKDKLQVVNIVDDFIVKNWKLK